MSLFVYHHFFVSFLLAILNQSITIIIIIATIAIIILALFLSIIVYQILFLSFLLTVVAIDIVLEANSRTLPVTKEAYNFII